MNANPVVLIGLSLALALLPFLISVGTSFVKISIVLSLLRNGLGTQQVPSSMVIMALSLALSFCVMYPVLDQTLVSIEKVPLSSLGKMSASGIIQTLTPAMAPWREFLTKHAGRRELLMLQSQIEPSQEKTGTNEPGESTFTTQNVEPGLVILASAFLLTELKNAFSMGIVLLLPFLALDLIVANVLVGIGMTMVSPQAITLPLKLLIFVLADGWLLLGRGLIESYA